MARGLAALNCEDVTDHAPVVVCALAIPLTSSIATGMGLGLIPWAAAMLFAGHFDQANPAVLALAAVFWLEFVHA
jgi:AGZA family xanthine/uracil permease-like MFS transporter